MYGKKLSNMVEFARRPRLRPLLSQFPSVSPDLFSTGKQGRAPFDLYIFGHNWGKSGGAVSDRRKDYQHWVRYSTVTARDDPRIPAESARCK